MVYRKFWLYQYIDFLNVLRIIVMKVLVLLSVIAKPVRTLVVAIRFSLTIYIIVLRYGDADCHVASLLAMTHLRCVAEAFFVYSGVLTHVDCKTPGTATGIRQSVLSLQFSL